MSLGLLLLFGHITVMFAAVALSFGPTVMFLVARRQGQVPVLRALTAPTPLSPLIPILYVVGGLLGLATAINFGTNLLAPWLVIAYVLWFIEMGLGGAVHAPYYRTVYATLRTAPDGPLTPELAAIVDQPRELIAVTLDTFLLVAVVFDMVVKPFS